MIRTVQNRLNRLQNAKFVSCTARKCFCTSLIEPILFVITSKLHYQVNAIERSTLANNTKFRMSRKLCPHNGPIWHTSVQTQHGDSTNEHRILLFGLLVWILMAWANDSMQLRYRFNHKLKCIPIPIFQHQHCTYSWKAPEAGEKSLGNVTKTKVKRWSEIKERETHASNMIFAWMTHAQGLPEF